MTLALANARRPTFDLYLLETSGGFVQSSVSICIRYSMSCTFSSFEEPLTSPEVTPKTAQDPRYNSFRPSLSIDEGEPFPEKPVRHKGRCSPEPLALLGQGSEITRGDGIIDGLRVWVRSKARVCIGYRRIGCIRGRQRCGCQLRTGRKVLTPGTPDFSLPEHQVSKTIFRERANSRCVTAVDSIFA